MRNRAKCKLCHSIIESFYAGHVDACKCGAITVFNGDGMDMSPFGSPNFLRIDDLGNEIIVSYKEKDGEGDGHKEPDEDSEPLSRADLIQEIDNMIKSFENLPAHAKYAPINGYDFISLMLIISNILKRE